MGVHHCCLTIYMTGVHYHATTAVDKMSPGCLVSFIKVGLVGNEGQVKSTHMSKAEATYSDRKLNYMLTRISEF